ncbi:MAG: hypothetical protein J6K38_05415 [Alistipes sp.]|nr:hypothetical protein [Alistipes sp.]
MARLSTILGAILRDMVAAQHEANMYAVRLSPAYRDRNSAAALTPPSVSLGEVELTLHCGFVDESVPGEICETDHAAVLRAIRTISEGISEVIVSCILTAIIRHSGDSGEGEGPVARLNRERTLRREFTAFLSRRLRGHLNGHRAEFISLEGEIDVDRLQEDILYIADEQFLSHSDLEEVFAADMSGNLRKNVRESLQTNLQIMLPRILKDVRLARREKYASLNVEVSSEALSKLPEESIHTLRLRISPRDLPLDTDTEEF